MAAGGDEHSVLPLRRQTVVLGHHGPLVGQFFDGRAACVEHGFDGKGHAFFQFKSRARLAVMHHLRVFVKHQANAVAAVFANHRVAGGLGERLDGVTDVTQAYAGGDLLDALDHRLMAGLDQPSCEHRGLANEIHLAGVAVIAILDHGDIDIEDVALLQHFVARNAVAHHVIDRRADGAGEAGA